MLITIAEIIDMVIMTAFVGYIFSDIFPKKQNFKDLYTVKKSWFDWDSIKYAAMITAPGLILHELAHKFLALSFGMQATFQAAYIWLGLGLLLKLIGFGFIVIVPAFVQIIGNGTPLMFSAISFAGPFMNLLIWLILEILIKKKVIPKKRLEMAYFAKEINKFLFIFNMIPIPGFDGFKVFSGLANVLFGL
jgi:Zn-dependent protease